MRLDKASVSMLIITALGIAFLVQSCVSMGGGMVTGGYPVGINAQAQPGNTAGTGSLTPNQAQHPNTYSQMQYDAPNQQQYGQGQYGYPSQQQYGPMQHVYFDTPHYGSHQYDRQQFGPQPQPQPQPSRSSSRQQNGRRGYQRYGIQGYQQDQWYQQFQPHGSPPTSPPVWDTGSYRPYSPWLQQPAQEPLSNSGQQSPNGQPPPNDRNQRRRNSQRSQQNQMPINPALVFAHDGFADIIGAQTYGPLYKALDMGPEHLFGSGFGGPVGGGLGGGLIGGFPTW